MKITDLRKQSIAELRETLNKTEDDLRNFKVDKMTKEVNNKRLGRSLRQQAARVKTIIREKELN